MCNMEIRSQGVLAWHGFYLIEIEFFCFKIQDATISPA